MTGKTAAEIIAERADAAKPSMGLTTWKNAPRGKIHKSDVSIAKNYLIEEEIKELERIVTMYLDYAENQAARQVPMRMADWAAKLDAFLKFNEYEVLTTAGVVSAEVAKRLAEEQYAVFRIRQDRTFESDFEKEIKRIEQEGEKKGITALGIVKDNWAYTFLTRVHGDSKMRNISRIVAALALLAAFCLPAGRRW